MRKNSHTVPSRGFTLIEMMVAVSIFALMTTYMLLRYGSLNQSITVTNLAYDIALTIRQAQTFGINVKESGTSGEFKKSFGAYFSTLTAANANKKFRFFSDTSSASLDRYDASDVTTTFSIKNGNYISRICTDSMCNGTGSTYDGISIAYKRPDPAALIYSYNGGNYASSPSQYAEIWVRSSDGQFYKKIVVRASGQISIED